MIQDTILTLARALSTQSISMVDKWANQHCLLCRGAHPSDTSVCSGCQADWPRFSTPLCRICGDQALTEDRICDNCDRQRPPYIRASAAFPYTFPVKEAILRMKFSRQPEWAIALADLAYPCFEARFDQLHGMLLPVPLHPRRRARRGYNQAALIARQLSLRSGWPVNETLCRRVRNTPHQARLDLQARQSNLSRSFEVCAPVPDCPVIIIDDVVTSGSTVSAISQVLQGAGCEAIHVFSIARALSEPGLSQADSSSANEQT